MKARVCVRAGTYRQREGWKIYGSDPQGRKVSIFTETRESAEVISEAVKAGEDVTLDMFYAGQALLQARSK